MSFRPAHRLLAACAGLSLAVASLSAAPQPTSFTYQGVLEDAGAAVDGAVTITFRLFDAATGGSQLGPTLTPPVTADDGVFSVPLDFGLEPYALNEALWLELTVDGQTLPRQALTAVPYALSTRGVNTTVNGVVGIGTRFPYSTSKMTISDTDLPGSANASSPLVIVRGSGSGFINVITANEAGLLLGDQTEPTKAGVVYKNASNALELRNNGNQTRMVIAADGQINMGSSADPIADLTIRPETGSANMVMLGAGQTTGISFGVGGNGLSVGKVNADGSGFESLGRWQNDGFLGVGTSTPESMLDINGAVTIRGGADIVEGFESECDTAFEPGTVLVIDPHNPGKLMCADVVYDKKVAGVVSGAGGVKPGIKLGQDGVLDGDIPVAMTGRVYVKASAENGAIEPGDLLTTASVPGHAMKATDHDRSNGAVIGKAMSELDTGTGLVLVLVNLQ